ncbi:MAG: AAA family ATPase [Nitrospirae bacterium]|nr:MAG: AAA family ATPase [Nitrospirota bacterium]
MLELLEEAFGLKERPFSKTPDPRFLYLSNTHEEALARLQYAVEEKEIVLLTGEIGCGKTTLTRALMDSLDESYRVIYILNPRLTANQFVRTVAKRLEIDIPYNYKDDLLEAVYDRVYQLYEEGITPVIIIDEAQLIPKRETFEEIRLLSNFQLDHTNLLSIVLVAQPDIRRRLRHRTYAPLKQRIGMFYHLRSLNRDEVKNYIEHRLRVSGREDELFTQEAIDEVYRFSRGIPRLINSVANASMLEALSREALMVTAEHVKGAAQELEIDGFSKD